MKLKKFEEFIFIKDKDGRGDKKDVQKKTSPLDIKIKKPSEKKVIKIPSWNIY